MKIKLHNKIWDEKKKKKIIQTFFFFLLKNGVKCYNTIVLAEKRNMEPISQPSFLFFNCNNKSQSFFFFFLWSMLIYAYLIRRNHVCIIRVNFRKSWKKQKFFEDLLYAVILEEKNRSSKKHSHKIKKYQQGTGKGWLWHLLCCCCFNYYIRLQTLAVMCLFFFFSWYSCFN